MFAKVVALAVRYRYDKLLTGAEQSRERRVGLFDADVEVLAAELQAAVAQHRSRQKPGFKQDLEPVADPENRPATPGEGIDLSHDRREARHGPGAQVIAVGEAAGKND